MTEISEETRRLARSVRDRVHAISGTMIHEQGRQAGTEIEITEEMVDAVCDVLLKQFPDDFELQCNDFIRAKIARQALEAALSRCRSEAHLEA